MTAYFIRRLWQMIPTLLGVVLLIFFLFTWVGGDPSQVLAGKISSPEEIANIRKQLGVDQPYWRQLLIFGEQIVTGDFGRSWSTNEKVSHIFATRIGPTLTIMVPIMLLETALGIIFALGVAYVRGSLTDRAIMIACTVAMSISFLVYIIVGQWLFGFLLGWFPVQGWSDSFWRNLVEYAPLPVFLALLVSIAPTLRLYRSFFLDEINQDYVRTARAKGLSETTVMFKHVMRNAMIPILTNVAIALAVADDRVVPAGEVLLHPRAGPGSHHRSGAQRLSRDQGDHRVPCGIHDVAQPARGRAVQVGRRARRIQMRLP